MSLRVTLMLDAINAKKAHMRQAETIRKTGKNCSFSKIINEMLAEVKK